MKIGILGTRGIPNNYGGFEQFAEYLSQGLHAKGCEVFVYNSHNHPYRQNNWRNIHIIHQYDPENRIGLSGQFIYDLNCILDSRKRNFDVLLQLGYTTNSLWHKLLPKNPIKICNPDGMEWKRSKYPAPVKRFLKYAEKLAVQSNQLLIADSEVIKDYYIQKYQKTTIFVAYPAIPFTKPDSSALEQYELSPDKYNMLIARLQPDNNIETIISGYVQSATDQSLLVIGNSETRYGHYLKQKYTDKRIRYLNAIYDQNILNNLRHFAHLYFHGHSAGGTNPSLLEAMASSALICAHDNEFNKSVLKENAFYFSDTHAITSLLDHKLEKSNYSAFIENNMRAIHTLYNPERIINQYYNAFQDLTKNKKH
jgi:glycosyltransferase involved in cell wall biosynthesis